MSLEESLNRVARALELAGEIAAVAKIIRQRDEAIKRRERWKTDADYYKRDRDSYAEKYRKSQRQPADLRGVIRRMKGQPNAR